MRERTVILEVWPMEFFEITFFHPKHDGDLISLDTFYDAQEALSFLERKCLTDFFNEQDRDFYEIRLSIPNLIFTEENILKTIKGLFTYVSRVYEKTTEIIFATGIYEITYYLTEKLKKVEEFDTRVFEEFPIIFLRPENDIAYDEVLFENEYAICVLNKDAQDLFAIM